MDESRIIPASELRRHQVVQAWQRLCSCALVPQSIEVLKHGGKGSVYRLHGLLSDGKAVIGKRCRADKGTRERSVYQHVLPTLGSPPLDYFGSINDGEWIWLFLEDVGDVRYDPADSGHRAAAASWLGTLHATIDRWRVPPVFPDRGVHHYAHDLGSARRSLSRVFARLDAQGRRALGKLTHSLELVESAWATVEAVCLDAPPVFSHNDCLPKNIHIRRSGAAVRIAAFDWGGAGWAPLGADLGLLALPEGGPPETEPDYAVYGDVIAHRWPGIGPEPLRRLANVGQLFWGLKVVSRGLEEIEHLPQLPDYLLDKLIVYEQALARALRFVAID